MQRNARIFMNNRSQAVRLPVEFQFKGREVFIRKEGADVLLPARPLDWSSYLAEGPVASSSSMEDVEASQSWSTNGNASLHAGHAYLFLRNEALERVRF